MSQLLSDMDLFFTELSLKGTAIAFEYPMPEMTDPLNPEPKNPFLAFVGQYKVRSRKCMTDWPKDPHYVQLTELEISPDQTSVTHALVKEISSNSSSQETFARN